MNISVEGIISDTIIIINIYIKMSVQGKILFRYYLNIYLDQNKLNGITSV